MRQVRFPIRMLLIRLVQRHDKIRQEHNDLRHIRDYQEHSHHNQKLMPKGLAQPLNRNSRYSGTNKEGSSHRRRNQSDAQIQNHHHAEVHHVHTCGLGDGKKNRSRHKDNGGHIHNGSQNSMIRFRISMIAYLFVVSPKIPSAIIWGI